VIEVAGWSDVCGYEGILVYTDNGLVDPWLVAHAILQHTSRLCPLVAVQPIYMHPYTVAKLVSSLAALYGRRVYLNMVAGGFANDLMSLDDGTPHDQRYARLIEYTRIVQGLLEPNAVVTLEGSFYRLKNVRMTPAMPPELRPGVLLSGSSEAGLAAARALGATAVQYPKPAEAFAAEPAHHGQDIGIRVGIIARPDEAEAWSVARDRFPEDRKGQLAHQLAMKVSDSVWHRQLSQTARETGTGGGSPYWLVPFNNYKTFCPYLVGSYDTVGRELARYLRIGCRTIITDVPFDEIEMKHTDLALRRGLALVTA
jgi:alkanesulfonate monooxygenase